MCSMAVPFKKPGDIFLQFAEPNAIQMLTAKLFTGCFQETPG